MINYGAGGLVPVYTSIARPIKEFEFCFFFFCFGRNVCVLWVDLFHLISIRLCVEGFLSAIGSFDGFSSVDLTGGGREFAAAESYT